MNGIIFGMDVQNILNYAEIASNTDHVLSMPFFYNCFDISKAFLFHAHPSLPENYRILFPTCGIFQTVMHIFAHLFDAKSEHRN